MEQFQVTVDTINKEATIASAERWGLDCKVLSGEQWPHVQVTGEYQPVLFFLDEHLGDSEETSLEYLQEHGEKL